MRYRSWEAYGQSKLANLLFAKGLADHIKDSGVANTRKFTAVAPRRDQDQPVEVSNAQRRNAAPPPCSSVSPHRPPPLAPCHCQLNCCLPLAYYLLPTAYDCLGRASHLNRLASRLITSKTIPQGATTVYAVAPRPGDTGTRRCAAPTGTTAGPRCPVPPAGTQTRSCAVLCGRPPPSSCLVFPGAGQDGAPSGGRRHIIPHPCSHYHLYSYIAQERNDF